MLPSSGKKNRLNPLNSSSKIIRRRFFELVPFQRCFFFFGKKGEKRFKSCGKYYWKAAISCIHESHHFIQKLQKSYEIKKLTEVRSWNRKVKQVGRHLIWFAVRVRFRKYFLNLRMSLEWWYEPEIMSVGGYYTKSTLFLTSVDRVLKLG